MILGLSKERALALTKYNLSIEWPELETCLAKFYLDAIDAQIAFGWLANHVWPLSNVRAVMPGDMNKESIMSDLLGAPTLLGNQNILTTLSSIASKTGALPETQGSKSGAMKK